MITAETKPARNMALDGEETCAICGESARNAFCHIYGETETTSLCSPSCAEIYLHRPKPGALASSDFFAPTPAQDVA